MQAGEWYRRWFGEEYLELYPHRDDAEAARAVKLFLRLAPTGERWLDLACGAGRHLRLLTRAGGPAVGLDLSAPLLRRAREAAPSALLVRADMRNLPFADAAFGGTASFFTSFGYFDAPEEDRRVLREVRRVLRPGGVYLLDFLNAAAVRRGLVPEDVRRIGRRTVRQRRHIEDGVVVKRIEIEDPSGGPSEVYHERVRLYGRAELEGMLRAAELPVQQAYGDYAGHPFGHDAERLILAGRAG